MLGLGLGLALGRDRVRSRDGVRFKFSDYFHFLCHFIGYLDSYIDSFVLSGLIAWGWITNITTLPWGGSLAYQGLSWARLLSEETGG